MKIVVLCGGLSPERDVSISSGTRIAKTLKQNGHQIVLVDMYFGLENWQGSLDNIFDNPPPLNDMLISEQEPDLEEIRSLRRIDTGSDFGDRVIEVCQMADIVFMGLHGQCGEDGKVQAAFDLLGIRYTGSGFLGSAVAMDKDMTKQIIAQHQIRTAAWKTYSCRKVTAETVLRDLTLPLVVKPDNSGSSIGVSIVHSEDDLKQALKTVARDSEYVVIEQYIKGREIQVGILDGKALPSIEIIPKDSFYDYKNKYQAGAATEITPAPIPAEAEERVGRISEKVFHLLRLDVYSRADFIYDENGEFWFLEINTLPGMTPTSLVPQEAAAAGYSYGDLCEKIIEVSMRKYNQ